MFQEGDKVKFVRHVSEEDPCMRGLFWPKWELEETGTVDSRACYLNLPVGIAHRGGLLDYVPGRVWVMRDKDKMLDSYDENSFELVEKPVSDQIGLQNHIGNIQWMAQGFGGTLNPEKTEWTFRFDLEEYNCVVRYLSNPKFNWIKNGPISDS